MRRLIKGLLLGLAVAGALGIQGMLHESPGPASPGYTGLSANPHRCCSQRANHVPVVHVHFGLRH
jgi:hypothetical protein